MPEGDLDILRAQAAKKALDPSEEAQRKHSWDLNVISQDPKDPQKSFAMTGSPGSDPKRLYVGDFTPEGDAVVGFENQGIRLLPEQPGSKEYTRYMRDKAYRPRVPRRFEGKVVAEEDSELEQIRQGLLDMVKRRREDAARVAIRGQQGGLPPEPGALPPDPPESNWGDYERFIDAQIKHAKFPDPRTDVAVKAIFEDMRSVLDDKPELVFTTPDHQDGIPDRVYIQSGNGEQWEWTRDGPNGNPEVHRAY
jgi:hypothetical protein